jgi:hypothetical protein
LSAKELDSLRIQAIEVHPVQFMFSLLAGGCCVGFERDDEQQIASSGEDQAAEFGVSSFPR